MRAGRVLRVMGLLAWAVAAPAAARVLHVDTAATGANDGTSWQDAYADLQAALAAATAGDEIWVAAGRYVPGTTRDSTFQLVEGVALYGGFAGGETERDQRDWRANETVLSGDVNGDDIGFTNNGENVYHVVTGADAAVLDGFTIEGGNAGDLAYEQQGGGLYNPRVSPLVVRCTFLRNSGSAMLNEVSEAVVVSSRFLGNQGLDGGAMRNQGSDVLVLNTLFLGNRAAFAGGALYNGLAYGPNFLEVHISSPALIHCTIVANTALTGAALFSQGYDGGKGGVPSYVEARLQNSIVWGNRATGGGGPIGNNLAQPYFRHCLIEGGAMGNGGLDLGGNLDVEPLLGDLAGADGEVGTRDDRPQPAVGSPCIDAGDAGGAPPDLADLDGDGDRDEPLPLDLEGRPRTQGPAADIGAYEGAIDTLIVSVGVLAVPEGGTASFEVSLEVPPPGPLEVHVEVVGGDEDVFVQSGAVLSFDTSNHAVPQSVVVAALDDADLRSGTALLRVRAPGAGEHSVEVGEIELDPLPAVLRVAPPGPGTWPDAFQSLQEALDAARASQGTVREIWVAAGTYRPTALIDPSFTRSTTFRLLPGVALYGGFGGTETLRAEADPVRFTTILSGDLLGDDAARRRSDNAPRVVTGASGATLDGFTITAGYGLGGSGLYNVAASPIVNRCRFTGNESAWYGGAVASFGNSAPRFTGCVFQHNRSDEGGAMFSDASSTPIVNSSVFSVNRAEFGGAVYVLGSARFVNCVFTGNQARQQGGALLASCLSGKKLTLLNSTLAANKARQGGGLMVYAGRVDLRNSILAANTASSAGAQIFRRREASVLVTACDVIGSRGSGPRWDADLGTDGGGNLDGNPRFANVNDPDGPDNRFATADDGLRLTSRSPCVDAGLARGAPRRDLTGQPRARRPGIDLGAYELR